VDDWLGPILAKPDSLLPDDVFAKLEAYLRTHPWRASFAAMQRAARGNAADKARLDEDAARWKNLRFALRYNRRMREGRQAPANDRGEISPGSGDAGEDAKLPTPLPTQLNVESKYAKPPTPTTKTRDKNTADDRRKSVKGMREALRDNGLWGVTVDEIARRSHIHIKTLYRYLKHPTVLKTWNDYQRKSKGKTPPNLDDLGDDFSFSFLDRE
jgi:AcrR family transcriptional regulator